MSNNEDDLIKKKIIPKVSSQKSMFDNIPKKPSIKDLEQKIEKNEQKNNGYKQAASDLAILFNKSLNDKTLKENKNQLMLESERDLLIRMLKLATEINNSENELEGMGSLGWIALLFKSCLSMRDRINNLEYKLLQIENFSIEKQE